MPNLDFDFNLALPAKPGNTVPPEIIAELQKLYTAMNNLAIEVQRLKDDNGLI